MPTSALGSSAAKRRNQMTRQLSLQGTAPAIGGVARRGLRRQQSDDVTDKTDLGLRIGSELTSKTNDKHSRTISRPKPVRLAWGERHQDNPESPGEGVEVVARRCEGLPRPSTRVPRSPNYSLFEKEAPALTREQLAERLRRAWRGRGQKSNLDIFLAHSRPESATTARSEDTESDITLSLYKPIKNLEDQPKISSFNLQEKNDLGMDTNENKPISDILNFKMFPVEEVRIKLNGEQNKENIENSSTPPTNMSASERRASFKSSYLINKTITGSFSDGPDDDPGGTEFKVFLTKAPTRPPLQRTSSAPSQTSSRPMSPANTKPQMKISKPVTPPARKVPNSINYDYTAQEESRERAAVARRKLKSTVARRKTKDHDESSDEDDRSDIGSKKQPRRRQLPRGSVGSDIITMVSLVSPAESDEEEPENVAPILTSVVEKKNEEVPQSVGVSSEPQKLVHSQFILQNSAILRKSTKTVSFQAHPPVSRSCSANFPLRRVPPGAPIIIPTPITAPSHISSVQLQEKFSSNDSRGIKRRLIRAKTAPSKEDEENTSSDEVFRTDTPTEPVSIIAEKVISGSGIEEEGSIDDATNEPELKSPKEKECWVLYKRMLDKGVAVSYETILRGMLTPTEYRLRKNQLSRC